MIARGGDGRNVGALGFGASCGSEAAISCVCWGVQRGWTGTAGVQYAVFMLAGASATPRSHTAEPDSPVCAAAENKPGRVESNL